MLSVNWSRVGAQLLGRSPFEGDIVPSRVPLVSLTSSRPSLPFPHPWNFGEPLTILDSIFHGADALEGSGRHNRYLDVPGFTPVFVTRDPRVIRAISQETGEKPGQFDRDTLPSAGIARATGEDTLLYANGERWKHQKRLATPPFARTSLFQPEAFQEFEQTFRETARARLGALRARAGRGGTLELRLEPEIKAIMLEMLVNNFFGAALSYDEIRERHVPALERVVDHIVRDTVMRRFGVPMRLLPGPARWVREAERARATFEELTDVVLATRGSCKGQWRQFKSDAPDAKLRSNVRVFLAGALEATTSYASWALAHLARHPAAQMRLYEEVSRVGSYSPQTLEGATYLGRVLEETLRLTPALYFHPRRPTVETWVETSDGARLKLPARTHVLLDVWHANRHEDHWGKAVTGYAASDFAPERWEDSTSRDLRSKDLLHFGFGHGPRFCPGKSLGQLEVALVVGGCIKLFEIEAVREDNQARAGVSTKPADGVLVRLRDRGVASEDGGSRARTTASGSHARTGDASKCPFSRMWGG